MCGHVRCLLQLRVLCEILNVSSGRYRPYLVPDEEEDDTQNEDKQADELGEAETDSERVMKHADNEAGC